MLKCTSICTYEVDDRAVAIEEIKNQLSEKIELLDSSVGIIMCHPEFITSGMLKHICENLPFDIVGVTTAAQAINGEAGDMILTIFVMTSDTIRFKAGMTECMNDGVDDVATAAYKKSSEGETEEPGLALLFPTIMINNAGDDYVTAWQKNIPRTPLFGTLAADDTPTFEDNEAIFNGDSSSTKMSYVLAYGDINPRFLIGTIPEENVMPYSGEITSSTGSVVKEINGMNTREYFESIGFESCGISSVNYLFLPFLIDLKTREDYDGVPVIRVLELFNDDGTAVFHGIVDEGSTFTLLRCESQDVVTVTKRKIDEINQMDDINGVLMFSCIVRRIVTMTDNFNEEFEIAKDSLRSDIPFMMGCAGGEICPTMIKNGIPINRYHEYSMVILIV